MNKRQFMNLEEDGLLFNGLKTYNKNIQLKNQMRKLFFRHYEIKESGNCIFWF